MVSHQSIFDLTGKVACVTGASAGIGYHVASVLVGYGVKVVGVARREESLYQISQNLGENFSYVAADLLEKSALYDVCSSVGNIFGTPDILVNAAGINAREPASEVTSEGWETTINLNLSSPFFIAQAFSAGMIQKGWGRVVNFASLQSFRAFKGGIAYGASKGGVAQMTRAMAEAWSSQGVNVNAIGPGFFKTELTEAVFQDGDQVSRNAAQTCIGRNGEMNDLDGPILFLCSDASRYVTGQILMVDGGFTAK